MEPTDFSRIIERVPLFRDLSPGEVGELLGVSKLFRARAGVQVVEEGAVSAGMYILVAGKAEVVVKVPENPPRRIALLEPGDVFGELALVDHAPANASVRMLQDSTLYFLESSGFATLRGKLRPAAYKLLRALAPILCRRLREVNGQVAGIFADPEKSLREFERLYPYNALRTPSNRPRWPEPT